MKNIKKYDIYVKENILYPYGGKIGGDHRKPISDKEWDNYTDKGVKGNRNDYPNTGETSIGYNAKTERWKTRFENYFGTKDADLVYQFLKTFDTLFNVVEKSKNEEERSLHLRYFGDIVGKYSKFEDIFNALNINNTEDLVAKYKQCGKEFELLKPSKANNWLQD